MKKYEPNIDKKTKRFVKKYDDGYGARNSTLTVSISEDLKNEVKALAKSENESLSNMINIILVEYLCNYKKDKAMKSYGDFIRALHEIDDAGFTEFALNKLKLDLEGKK